MAATRRSVLAGIAAVGLLSPQKLAAAEGRGLFWRIEAPNDRKCILFGTADVAAGAAPAVIFDGLRYVPATQRIVRDYVDPGWRTSLAGLPPVSRSVDAALVRELAAALGGVRRSVDAMSALEAAASLFDEGAAPAATTAADVLLDRASDFNRPVTAALSDADLAALRAKTDLAAANDRIGDDAFREILAFRAEAGPLGRFHETAYRRRAHDELAKFHGLRERALGVDIGLGIDAAALREALVRAFPGTLEAEYNPLVLMRVDAVLGLDGLLATLVRDGSAVTVLA